MKNKILFLDVDNTILFSDIDQSAMKISGEKKHISPKTIDLIKELQKQFYIVIATGRRTSNYERLKKYIKIDYAIIEHGALIFGTGLDTEWSKSLKAIIGTPKIKKGILWDYEAHLNKTLKTESEGRYGSFRLSPQDNKGLTQKDLENRIKKIPKELTYVKNESFIDIIPKYATKIHAMEFLAKKLNIEWKNTFFVGDDYNDADALKKVSHPYTHSGAMKEIIQLVKEREGYVSIYKSFSAINDILLNIQNYSNHK